MTKPTLSVVVVNYNCASMILDCAASVRAHVRIPYEFLVVDNASKSADLELLRTDPSLDIVEAGDNLGFGRANNLGASRAVGQFLAILNPDTLVDSEVLDRLVGHLESNPDVGLAAPFLIQEDGTLQNSWNVPEDLRWEFAKTHYLQGFWYRSLWRKYERKWGRTTPWPVGVVVGACMVVRTEEFNALGGFDPDFFMNGEDGELCDRIRASGKSIHLLPWLTLHHHEGGTQRLDWSRYMTHRFDAFRIAIGKRYSGPRWIAAMAMWWEAVLTRIVIGALLLRGPSRTRIRGYLNAAKLALKADG